MVLRPQSLRSLVVANSSSICSQCLRKLSRSPYAFRRTLSTTSSKDAAIASRHARNAFKKEYFWANGILNKALAGAKHGAWSTTPIKGLASASTPSSQSPKDGNTTNNAAQSSPDFTNGLSRRQRKQQCEPGASGAAQAFPIPLDASSKLSATAQQLPSHSWRRLLATYLSLSKPRLTFLIVLTTTAAYSLYPVPALLAPTATAAPSLSTLTLLFLTTGTALCSASANALNMLFEPAYDAKMSRTRNRPLVRGLIKPRGALLFAIVVGATGVAGLYYGVNPTTAFLGGLNILLYAGCYTPLKRISVVNTWVGAIVGGIPPLMGWAAAAGQCASHGGTWQELLLSESSAGGWLLAALLFAWQFPHFNALSWTIREEYKLAGHRMLAWVNPAMNARVALRYSVAMFPVCFGLAYVGVTGWGFVGTSAVVNGWMTWQAWRFWRLEGARGSARGLFWASVWHLPIVLVLAMAQKRGLWDRVWKGVAGVPREDEWEDEEWEEEEEEGDGPAEYEKQRVIAPPASV